MRAITHRLDALEQKANPAPARRLVILTLDADCSPADETRGLAEAHTAAGDGGRVVVVKYEARQPPTWWTPEIVQAQAALHAARPLQPPYTLDSNDDRRGL